MPLPHNDGRNDNPDPDATFSKALSLHRYNDSWQELNAGTTCGAIICIKNSHFKMGKRCFPNKKILRNSPCLPACKQKNIATRLRDTT